MDEIKQKFRDISKNAMIDSKGYIRGYFKISDCRIETDDGVKRTYWYQYTMVNQIINNRKTYLSNQSHALYGDYCFSKSRKIGQFEYNMILLENSHIYLYNLTTDRVRRIHYDMEQNTSNKRKRK